MNAVDSHIHWFPSEYYEFLSQRATEPRTVRDGDGWQYLHERRDSWRVVTEWTDLEQQFATQEQTGVDMTLVTSMGIHSDLDGLPLAEAREGARMVNEAWSSAQRRYPGRFFAAAALPLQDVDAAIEEMEHAVGPLDLRGVSLPGSIDGAPLDTPEMEAFWTRAAELDVPLFIHPTDGAIPDMMRGHGGSVYRSLGRVVDSSVAVLRLVLGGTFDRHPSLRVLHFHAGGVLPYAAGRLDKNTRGAAHAEKPTEYLRRMWVDTAMPHALTIDMALKFYGTERVLYGSDNPCWNPMASLEALRSLHLPEADERAVLDGNARALLDLRVPASRAA
jgi:aminocarboxymuconate-semialdehyde decarboxylase